LRGNGGGVGGGDGPDDGQAKAVAVAIAAGGTGTEPLEGLEQAVDVGGLDDLPGAGHRQDGAGGAAGDIAGAAATAGYARAQG
jgi:hypothetical protein